MNNHKEWFDDNKSRYLDAKSNMEEFMESLMNRLNETDVIEGYKVYRIYRDVRFSKDKTPYKTYLHAYLKRQGAERRRRVLGRNRARQHANWWRILRSEQR